MANTNIHQQKGNHKMKIAIIGGGAAGFFSAINAKANYPDSEVQIFEKSLKILSKVKISGGGRCNVTNGCKNVKTLSEGYPRGAAKLKKAFKVFDNKDTWKWFEERNVPLKTEPDNRVFPISNDSQSIIDCLLEQTRTLNIQIRMQTGINGIKAKDNKINLTLKGDKIEEFDKVIVATGGSPKRSGFDWLAELGHEIIDPSPSLFTFNMPNEPIIKLMGVVAENAAVSIQGTKLKSDGPLLITHWGMSGPAILKLSAFGARMLKERNYEFKAQVNWVNENNNELIYQKLNEISLEHNKKKISSVKPYKIRERLWLFLLEKRGLNKDKKWEELGKKGLNKIVNILSNDVYSVKGKTTFKEEFVTCGGISLESINFKTMESLSCPNLYFAGEVLDIDGITGGYNFQAAWTTAFIAGMLK